MSENPYFRFTTKSIYLFLTPVVVTYPGHFTVCEWTRPIILVCVCVCACEVFHLTTLSVMLCCWWMGEMHGAMVE